MHQSLPLFPNLLDSELEKIFSPLCMDISQDKVADLLMRINEHTKTVRLAMRQNEFIDIALVDAIALTLGQLLKELGIYPENKRRLIIGAANYFIQSQDAQADFSSILGFDDDAAVLNYVLKEIGRDDLRVEI